jgi:chaperone modulatory protein CbpM
MGGEPILTGRVEEGECLTLEELCAVCALEAEWVMRRVEEGLFPAQGAAAVQWRFSGTAVSRAKRMREIERDFDAAPELAALVADLLEELDALRARLRRAGIA